MAHIQIYTTQYCPYCVHAKALLDKKNVAYQEIAVDDDSQKRIEMERKSNRHTVPQIFINDNPIGGCDELHHLESTGQLDKLLNQSL